MARRNALRGYSKVMDRCPHCGSRKPKELVEKKIVPSQGMIIAVVILGIFTCGVGLLLLIYLFNQRSVLAYCDECDETFSCD